MCWSVLFELLVLIKIMNCIYICVWIRIRAYWYVFDGMICIACILCIYYGYVLSGLAGIACIKCIQYIPYVLNTIHWHMDYKLLDW